MSATQLSELLSLPATARAELAITLWESLSDVEREAGLTLEPAEREELDRRWAAHIADPGSAVAWEEVRRKLQG
jgi:putative addiction module component (TIGR02574 family)